MSQHKRIFFIGAPKCGTTSICDLMMTIDDISVSKIKEPNYFCSDEILQRKTHASDNNRIIETPSQIGTISHSALVTEEKTYESLFDKEKPYLVDFSTNYLVSKHAPKNIKEAYEDEEVKIVIIVRNPYKRAVSHYSMDKSIGFDVDSFNAECAKELALPKQDRFTKSQAYLAQSDCIQDIHKFQNIFGDQNVKVILFERLFKDNQEIQSLFDFIGLDKKANLDDIQKSNEAVKPRFSTLNKLAHETGLKNFLRSLMPAQLKKYMRNMLYKKGKHSVEQDDLSKEVRQEFSRLETEFNSHFGL